MTIDRLGDYLETRFSLHLNNPSMILKTTLELEIRRHDSQCVMADVAAASGV